MSGRQKKTIVYNDRVVGVVEGGVYRRAFTGRVTCCASRRQ